VAGAKSQLLVLGQAFTTVLAGVAIGIVAVVLLGRVIAELLYMVSPYNLLTLGAVSALLVCIAMLAAYRPARRATGIDPLSALRSE
jgi:ABC-type antimicrobial peptide transport system permease subunit